MWRISSGYGIAWCGPAYVRSDMKRTAVGLIVAVLLGLPAAVAAPPARVDDDAAVRVIVQATSTTEAADAVVAAGGRVVAALPIVDGVAASVPQGAISRIEAVDAVVAVTPDAPIAFSETTTTSSAPEPRSVYVHELGADTINRSGIDGANATVALIDTGVARVDASGTAVPDLAGRVVPVPDPHQRPAPEPDAQGRVTPRMVPCADFSGDTPFGVAPSCGDRHGHGTFMAGIIAGNGAASGGRYRGVAPATNIADIRIASANGAADVSKVLAAIQYVVSFKDVIQPPVRVINLSLGTTSRQDHRRDPLNFAVQRAWTSGLVVVVAAGNTGPDASTISKPADDPLVLTVGAVDDLETTTLEDDRLPKFSARGPATFSTADGSTLSVPKPDVVAPGARLVSLRPVDGQGRPTAVTTPDPPAGSWSTSHYRRGSGTSMSAAAVSGVAALYADANTRLGRNWTNADPDRFKRAVLHTARPVAEKDASSIGRGLVNASGAISRALADGSTAVPAMTSDASGRLDDSRGEAVRTSRECTNLERLTQLRLVGACEILITGERTAQDQAWSADAYREPWTGSSWYGSSWYGSSWYGSSWYGSSWYGSSWYGSSWYGTQDARPYGATVNGSSWYGAWE